MKMILFVMLLISQTARAGIGAYMLSALNQYRATRAYDNDDFNTAQQLLERGLVDYPHDSKLNYNLGCAYHKQKKEEQAQECFKRATATSNVQLKELAYFNMANSYVALEKLDDAIAAYEQVLALNPNNQQAQHNLEMIKKKKQEQQQQQNQQDKKDSKKDKQDNQNKNQNDQNDQQENQQNKNSQGDDQKNNKDEKQKEKDKQKNNEKNDQQDQQQGSDQQNKQSDQNKDQQGFSGKDAPQENKEQSQQEAHSDEQKGEHDKSVNAQYDKHAGNEKLDKYLQLVLMQAEKNDEEQYKKMIKAHVKQEMPAGAGQKNW